MAEESWPFDGTPGAYVTEDQWRAFARNFAKTGMVGSKFTDDAAAKVSAGSGAQVLRAAYPNGAYVDGMFCRDTASLALAVTENTNPNPRTDRVVLRLDPTNNEITTEVLEGTPAGSPTPPALTHSSTGIFETPLYRFTMPGSGSAQNPTGFVDERRWSTASYGGNVGYGTGLAINPGQTKNEQVAGRQAIPAFAGELIEVAYSTNIRVEGTDYQGISWGVSGIGLDAVSEIPVDHYYRQIPRASGAIDWFAYDFRWRYRVLSDFPWVGISVANRGITPNARIIVGSTHYQITIL